MIISHKYKFAFIKTRKTAGSSIENILYNILGEEDICTGSTRDGTPSLNYPVDLSGHIAYYQLLKEYPEVKDYFTFSIERNPWDKCVSAFYWHEKIKPHLTENGFKHYLQTATSVLPKDYPMYRPFTSIRDVHVFKYEELDKIIPFMNDKFGLDLNPELINNTRMKSGIRKVDGYRQMYDDESKEFVSRMFEQEIKEFGYEF